MSRVGRIASRLIEGRHNRLLGSVRFATKGKYQQFLDDLRDQAQEAYRRLKSRRTGGRIAWVMPDEMGDLATFGAYLFAGQGLEGEDWDRAMLREFPQMSSADLERVLKYARKLYNKRMPNPRAQQSIKEYNKKYGLPEFKHLPYASVDTEKAKKIAEEYEKLPEGEVDYHTPEGRRARESYTALIKEINQQFEHLPIKVEPWQQEGQPYKNSREMMHDVIDNNHMWVFYGGDPHPMLTPEENYRFRAIHDYYTHAAHGFEFGPRGEENAWMAHRQMFTPQAIPALTNETRAQNSWVNFGPYAQHNRERPEENVYAKQKGYLIPEEYTRHEYEPFRMSSREAGRVAVSYAHLRTLLAGLHPHIHSVGILTAWNPEGRRASPEYNQRANAALVNDLYKKDLGPIPISGFYVGSRESSFLVPNMSRGLLLFLCKKYKQESVVYGGRTEKNGKPAFQFEMIDSRGNPVAQKTMEIVSGESIPEEKMKSYSYLGEDDPDWKPKYPWRNPRGKKRFVIPFEKTGSHV